MYLDIFLYCVFSLLQYQFEDNAVEIYVHKLLAVKRHFESNRDDDASGLTMSTDVPERENVENNSGAILTSTDSARRPHFLCKRVENAG